MGTIYSNRGVLVITDLSNDRSFAQELCDKNRDAIGRFQQQYSDELYFVASKFNSRNDITDSTCTYFTETGIPLQVTDAIQNTYLWLIDQVFLQSCRYEGRNNATFRTYITTTLNSRYTFLNWMRWNSPDSLIRYPRQSGYVPKVIQDHGELYGEVFILLQRRKSINQICSKLNLEENKFLEIQNTIEIELIEDGKIDLLYRPRIESFDPNPTEDEDAQMTGVQVQDSDLIDADLSLQLNEILSAIESLISEMPKENKRILNQYWTEGMKINDIYDEMINGSFSRNITVEESDDINSIINKSVYDLWIEFKENYPDLVNDYQLNRKNWRYLIKTVFENYNYKN